MKPRRDKEEQLSHALLLDYLDYDELSGVFTWKKAPCKSVSAGDKAGYLRKDGYVSINLKGVRYLAHRLAYFYITAHWPLDELDHLDRNKSNNAIVNLKDATRRSNLLNAESKRGVCGVKGVTPASKNRFRAQIVINGHNKNLGIFSTLEEASTAYQKAFDKQTALEKEQA